MTRSNVLYRANRWLDIGPDDPNYVEVPMEVVELIEDLVSTATNALAVAGDLVGALAATTGQRNAVGRCINCHDEISEDGNDWTHSNGRSLCDVGNGELIAYPERGNIMSFPQSWYAVGEVVHLTDAEIEQYPHFDYLGDNTVGSPEFVTNDARNMDEVRAEARRVIGRAFGPSRVTVWNVTRAADMQVFEFGATP